MRAIAPTPQHLHPPPTPPTKVAMAASFLFGLAESLIAKLASRAFEEACQVVGVYDDLQQFTRTLRYIKAVLLDAEQKQTRDPYSVLRTWLRMIRDALSDAENVMDEVEFVNQRKKVIKVHDRSMITKVNHFFSSSNPLAFRFRMARKIKQINERLDKIAADRHKFGLQIIDVDTRVVHMREMTYSRVIDSEVIGRKHDKEEIIKILIPHDDNDKNLSVISIEGYGGIGKTTLAKFVFNDERIDENFTSKMWVCVSDSDSFDIKQVIIKIINSADANVLAYQQNLSDLDIEQLEKHLNNKLKGQKFLLVLDDVWNDAEWVEVWDLMQVGAVGSKILVTTRSDLIASMMGTISSHILDRLSLEDSLVVFFKWAFKKGEEKKHPHLINIGREIVRKCGGYPLVLKTLGSLLFSKHETEEWEYVRDNEIWKSPCRIGIYPKGLEISYDRMPSYLKECFAMLSLYPKGHAIDSFHVTSLWRALGLLPSPNRNQTLKHSANQYLYELWSISLLQDFVDCGIGFSFEIHYLVHHLAAFVAGNLVQHWDLYRYLSERFETNDFFGINGLFSINGPHELPRHLSFSVKGLDELLPIGKLEGVRSILFPTAGIGANSKAFLNACLSRCKYLRFLDLSDSTYETLPRSIGKLKHLRYLSLENNKKIKTLPDSICNLIMLEMLILSGCTELETLPNGLTKFISLQHLEITTKQCVLPEDEIANLSSLQTLRIEFCNNLESLFGGIKLPALRVLFVANCRSLKSLPLDIEHFPALETLLVDNCDMLEMSEGHEDQNSNMRLKVLTVVSLPQLVTLPHWLQGSVKTLQHLSISSCTNLLALPEWLSAMICLKTLCITGCPNMLSPPSDIHRLATLERFEIDGYPELFSNSEPQVGESSRAHNTIDEPEDEEEIEELE